MTRPAGTLLRSFTLIELLVVMMIIGILGGMAYPRFVDYTAQARRETMIATIAAVETALAMTNVAYVSGNTAGLPPDSNGDYYPDHLGDTAAGEVILLEAILDPPLTHNDGAWKQFAGLPFPSGTLYTYIYDTNDNEVFDGGEALFWYDSSDGSLTTFPPP